MDFPAIVHSKLVPTVYPPQVLRYPASLYHHGLLRATTELLEFSATTIRKLDVPNLLSLWLNPPPGGGKKDAYFTGTKKTFLSLT